MANVGSLQLKILQVIAVQVRQMRRLRKVQALNVVVREIVLNPEEVKFAESGRDAAAGAPGFEFADDPVLVRLFVQEINDWI